MAKSEIRILVVDDFESWRRFISSALVNECRWQVVAEAADGLMALQKAEQLQPDLILLDIGLPALNGIEVARQIRKISPKSKILFVSEHRSIDIAREAVRAGGCGYVIKSHAGKDLLPALTATAEGRYFASADLANHIFDNARDESTVDHLPIADDSSSNGPSSTGIDRQHEVAFFPTDESLIDGFARFAKSALDSRNPVIVIATESHGGGIRARLRADGVDVEQAAEQGRLIEAEATEVLSNFMENGVPSGARITSIAERLIEQARKLAVTRQVRIAICGELAPTLLRQGNADAALRVERHFDDMVRKHGLDILCGYVLGTFRSDGNNQILESICAEHSAVHMR